MIADPYSGFVRFYNDLGPRLAGDIDFYTRCALEAGGPIVELGVGTGRVAIPIARAGVNVIGVDVSPAMMDEGKRRAAEAGVAERIRWVQADMREFVARPAVSLVTIPFRSFLHMTTTDDQLSALSNARGSLSDGGRLALNIFVPDPAFISQNEGRPQLTGEYIDDRGRRCELLNVPSYEAASQRLFVTSIRNVYEADRLVDASEVTFELRMVYRFEMEHLLVRSGFQVEHLYGGFDERPFTEKSHEMVWIARRA